MKSRSILAAFVLCIVFAASAVAVDATTNEVSRATQSTQPTFGLDRVGALQGELGGYPLWQYAASLLWVILAFVFAAIVDFLMAHQLRKLTAKTKTDLDDKLLDILRRPVKAVVMLLTLNVGIQMFQWPDWAEKILSTLFVIAVAITVVYVAMRLVDLVASFAEAKFFAADDYLARLVVPVLAKSLKVFVIIIGALTAAQYLGLPITSIIAGLGIGGIAVALAAQNTLANIFGTITILADRPFRVGDYIKIDKFEGTVETIGLRSTRLRTPDGHVLTIPNKMIADAPIGNVSLGQRTGNSRPSA